MSFDFVLEGTVRVVFDAPGTDSSSICSAGMNTDDSATILSDQVSDRVTVPAVLKCIVL